MITDSTNMVMPVAPSGSNGFGFGDGAGAGWWLMFLFFAMIFGWGNNGWGGNGTNNEVQRGFDQSSIMNGFTGVNSGISDIQQALCSGFNSVNAGIANGFAQAEIAANSRQMANMNQTFGISQQLSGMNATILAENCADRTALNDGVRDIIANQNAGFQSLKDYLCNEKISSLERELSDARFAASQASQTAAIEAGQRALASEIEQRLNPTPIPAWIVQNPSCCNTNGGCGCGNF